MTLATHTSSISLFRCYPRVRGARRGKPGHWAYVPRPQFHGRWDNADLYDSWYFSRSAVGAVAESFYNKREWIPEVFLTAQHESRVIAEFSYAGQAPLDLDDAATLLQLGVRPSEIVRQNLGGTQRLARRIYETSTTPKPADSVVHGEVGGITWWSSPLPSEASVLLWGHGGVPPAGLNLVSVQPLSVSHPAVVEAASRLFRPIG